MSIINKEYILSLIKENIPGIKAYIDEPMNLHTSFRIGGCADLFVSPSSESEILSVLKILKNEGIPVTVIGNGSNMLVSDEGVEGAVICIGKDFSLVSVNGNEITALSGALLSKIASVALENSLTGFEFAAGIPGSLGGAVVMNAGAYGGEMKDVVISTRYIATDGEIKECFGDEHGFAYRKSRFTDGEIILSSKIRLSRGNADDIKEQMRSLSDKRREKQPLEYPSAGSAFKRPEGYFAAKLIDDAGLKGYRSGNAAVSEKHCGFIVNYGGATAADVKNVIAHVQKAVMQKFGIHLEPEVRIIGR